MRRLLTRNPERLDQISLFRLVEGDWQHVLDDVAEDVVVVAGQIQVVTQHHQHTCTTPNTFAFVLVLVPKGDSRTLSWGLN